MAPPVLNNLRTVSAAWRDECSGQLVVEHPGGGLPCRVPIRNGGLVDPAQSRRLARGITVGAVRFEAGPAPGRGDRALLGKVLAAVSRVVSERITGTLPDEAVVELAMHPERLAGCVAPELVDRLAGRPAVVGALLRDGSATVQELRALGWLGVVRLQRARGPRARRSLPPVEAGAVVGTTPRAESEDLFELAPLPEAPVVAPRPSVAPAPPAGEPEAGPAILFELLPEAEEVDDPDTEESGLAVDPRPIPLPPHELHLVDEREAAAPLVHVGMCEPVFAANEETRLGGVAFGEEQQADVLAVGRLACAGGPALDSGDAGLDPGANPGLEDELAEDLPHEELGLLLGLPGATARARASATARGRAGAPPAARGAVGLLPPAPTAASAPPAVRGGGGAGRGHFEVDLAAATCGNYELGHLLDATTLRLEASREAAYRLQADREGPVRQVRRLPYGRARR